MRPPDGTAGKGWVRHVHGGYFAQTKIRLESGAVFYRLHTFAWGPRRAAGGRSGFKSFEALQKPPLTPPAAVFPIVWSALYLLMGIAAYLVWSSGDLDRGASLRMYFLQLLVNILWPLFFFRLQWRLFAFFWLLLLLALLSLTMAGFRYIRKSAYWLLVPYFLWVLFAGYLNLGIYLLNM